MKRYVITIIVIVLLFFPDHLHAGGNLVIIGGGSRPDYVMDKFIELAGGRRARIIVFPMASSDPVDTGEYYVEEFNRRGADNADYLIITSETADTEENFNALEGVTGIFFSGGDQRRHTAALLGTRLLDRIREIYTSGGVLGGTSAGAAVMSKVMITGDEYLAGEDDEPFSMIKADNVVTAEGFGFLDTVIIDQHFVQRKRHNRLISLVLEYPHLIGIGIDESTALIVDSDKIFHVLGERTVLVFDARNAQNTIHKDKNDNLTARDITLHILQSGESFSIDN